MGKKSPPRFQQRKEAAELEQVYNRANKKTKNKKGTAIIVVICLLLVLTAGVLAGFFFLSDGLKDGIIMDNVKVGGVNIGGLTKEEAVAALEESVVANYNQNPMVIVIADQRLELPASVTGITLDTNAAVEAAYELGRAGDRTAQKEQQLLASTTGISLDITPYLQFNKDAVIAELNKLGLTTTGEVVQSNCEIIGEIPDLTAEEAPVETQTLVIHMGQPVYAYDQDALLAQMLEAYKNNAFLVETVCEMKQPDALDLEALYQQYYIAPVDAVMDTETFEVSPHSYGYGFDLETAKLALQNAETGSDVAIPFTVIAPAQTKEALSSLLFRDVLSTHKATGTSSTNRNTNLRLACQAIDGTVIMPGEIFDYNETTGKRTTEKGYLPADGYAGGKTVKMVGGGVCQPSSIIYYCALLADMEIVTRSCHQYESSYMDYGMDATVSWGGPHFRFRNNTDYPIRIDASASGATVTIAIVGTDTKDYYVKMEYEILSKTGWTTEYIEMAPDNEEGYEDGDVISTPYTGYSVKTYRCRYSKADDSLIERVFEARSDYDHRNKQIAKIVQPEDTTDPTQPTEKPTDPTDSPITPPEVTTPPVTERPATEPPATEPPATNPPTTEAPAPEPDSNSGSQE